MLAYITPPAITATAIFFAVTMNAYAYHVAKRDEMMGPRIRATFAPIVLLASFYLVGNLLQVFNVITRPEYLSFVSPLTPFFWLIGFCLAPLSYIFGFNARHKQ